MLPNRTPGTNQPANPNFSRFGDVIAAFGKQFTKRSIPLGSMLPLQQPQKTKQFNVATRAYSVCGYRIGNPKPASCDLLNCIR